MKRKALAIIAVGLLIAADSKDEGKKKADKIEGTWEFVTATRSGKVMDEIPKGTKVIFTKDKMIMKMDDMENEMGTYKLDPKKKPAEIDVTFTDGSDKGKTGTGIYVIKNDMLTICHGNKPEDERPKKFESKEGDQYSLIVLKRVKK